MSWENVACPWSEDDESSPAAYATAPGEVIHIVMTSTVKTAENSRFHRENPSRDTPITPKMAEPSPTSSVFPYLIVRNVISSTLPAGRFNVTGRKQNNTGKE